MRAVTATNGRDANVSLVGGSEVLSPFGGLLPRRWPGDVVPAIPKVAKADTQQQQPPQPPPPPPSF